MSETPKHVVVSDYCPLASANLPEFGRRRLVISLERTIECRGSGKTVSLSLSKGPLILSCDGCRENPKGFQARVS